MSTHQPVNSLHYHYAHIFLKGLALSNPLEFWKDIFGKNSNRFLHYTWKRLGAKGGQKQPARGLKVSHKRLGGEVDVFLIQMPSPTTPSEAFLTAAVYLWQKKGLLSRDLIGLRYFTLELGITGANQSQEYHFCEWVSQKEHVSHGQLPDAKNKTLLNAIEKVLQ